MLTLCDCRPHQNMGPSQGRCWQRRQQHVRECKGRQLVGVVDVFVQASWFVWEEGVVVFVCNNPGMIPMQGCRFIDFLSHVKRRSPLQPHALVACNGQQLAKRQTTGVGK